VQKQLSRAALKILATRSLRLTIDHRFGLEVPMKIHSCIGYRPGHHQCDLHLLIR
jgi:hypothetical protein